MFEVRSLKSEVRTLRFGGIRFRSMHRAWRCIALDGRNMDEGWTRWVLEQYEFNLTSIHNADIRGGKLRQKFDANHHRRPESA